MLIPRLACPKVSLLGPFWRSPTGGNIFGKNTLDVRVNEAGLLTSTKSTTISNVTDVFKNLAATAGMPGALGLKIEKPGVVSAPCETVGDHSFVFEPATIPVPESLTICGMKINIERPRKS